MKFAFTALLVAGIGLVTPAVAETVVLASTTSVENSGLLAAILPGFTRATGIDVRVIAQGTGQALATAAKGDADLVLVHDPEAEEKFMAGKHGVTRREIAWNDFIVVGPGSDPANVDGGHDAARAFAAIAQAEALFVSRGDRSGTDTKEKRLWRDAKVTPSGAWYRDIGGGMGAALNAAATMDAYTLADRGTWLNFGNKRNLKIVVEGASDLINRYDVITLNPAEHSADRRVPAQRLADWLVSKEGQTAISGHMVAGETLFFPAEGAKP